MNWKKIFQPSTKVMVVVCLSIVAISFSVGSQVDRGAELGGQGTVIAFVGIFLAVFVGFIHILFVIIRRLFRC